MQKNSFYRKAEAVFLLLAMLVPNLGQVSLIARAQATPNTQAQVELQDKKTVLKNIKTEVAEAVASLDNKDYVPGELIVKFKDSVDLSETSGKAEVANFAKNKNLNQQEDFEQYNSSLLKLKDSKASLSSKIVELRNDPKVESVQPNYQYGSLSTELTSINDTGKANQWGLYNDGSSMVLDGQTITKTIGVDIDAAGAWGAIGGENNSVIVAVIDSGVAYNQPDLVGNMWHASAGSCFNQAGGVMAIGGIPVACDFGYDFENNDGDPSPFNSSRGLSGASHGTLLAGIIGATQNNANGMAGVAKNVKIMALRSSLTTSNIIAAIGFAKYNGAKVINASWGNYFPDEALLGAIDDFNGLFVAAAGNDANNNETNPAYPCAFSAFQANVICVAAVDENGSLASFSNYGATTVDIGAPGTNIYSSLATTMVALQDFNLVTPPAFPAGFAGGAGSGTASVSGNNVLFGDLARSPYSDSVNYLIESNQIDLSDLSALDLPSLDFLATCDTAYSTTSYLDYGVFRVSSDAVTYDSLYLGSTPLAFDEATIDAVHGDSNPAGSATYRFRDIPLESQYLTSTFHYGYQWVTDGADNNYEGCSIDDIKVKKITDGSGDGTNNNNYVYMSGTSAATPFVAGVAALAWSYNGSLSAANVKQIINSNGTANTSLTGKTVSGKMLSANRVLSYLSSAKKITSFGFSFSGYTNNIMGTINETAHTIKVVVPYSRRSEITALTPVINFEGTSVSPVGGVARDFTNSVNYIVTASDGGTQAYAVTVTTGPAISSFSLPGATMEAAHTDSDGSEHLVLAVRRGANLSSLASTVTVINGGIGTTLSPAAGVAQDFSNSVSNPIAYLLTRDNGDGTFDQQNYRITVLEAPGISNFSFTGVNSALTAVTFDSNRDAHASIAIPFNANPANLTPNIEFDSAGQWAGTLISPSAGVVTNFTAPIKYTLTWSEATTGAVVAQNYYVSVTQATNSFPDSGVAFDGKNSSVTKKSTTSEKVKINFKNAANAVAYMVSTKANFAGASWQPMASRVTVKLKKKSGKQNFYIKFMDAKGFESPVEKKTVEYLSPERVIKNSKNIITRGEILIQSGKAFSKNSKVALYFSKAGGGYYPPSQQQTDSNGAFSISFKAMKAKGKYQWYALDLKTGKKSKVIQYEIK
jgi:thermitase